MNIITIVNKLKELNLLADTEEEMSLFSDCFNKFGISLLLLQDEKKFNRIVELLKKHEIPLQKGNGIYVFRLFAVEVEEMEAIFSEFQEMDEMDFLRIYPEMIAEPRNIHNVLVNLRSCKKNGTPYKIQNGYDMNVLLPGSHYALESEAMLEETDVNVFLKHYLNDSSLIERLIHMEANPGEEDLNVALELQKVENKICEEFLFPVEDGWKIVIDNKEVNSFQEVKNTINTITKLNLSITFHDALLVVLFYKTTLLPVEVKGIIEDVLFKEEL